MAPHSSTLAWKIPRTEEPGGLQFIGSLRVGHDWATLLSLFTFMHWRRKWQPTPVFLPGESQRWGSLVGCRPWGHTESDMTERLTLFSLFMLIYRCAQIYPWRRQWHPTPVLLPGKSHGWRSLVGCSPWGRWESDTTDFTFTFHFHALEKEMATHSSVLAWRFPGTGEPGRLPSMGSHRVRHDWSDLAAAASNMSPGQYL